jgi:hypothetical protein
MLHCTHCGHYFPGSLPKPEPEVSFIPRTPSKAEISIEEIAEQRRKKIRRSGDALINIAAFFAVVAMLIFIGSLVSMKSGNDASTGFICGASLTGIALWFYLIGQVTHIRANTEK